MSGYTRIYYDYKLNRIHLWYVDENGTRHKEEVDNELEYYVEDKTGQSPIKDIYGTPYIKAIGSSKKGMRELFEGGTKTCEATISEEIKFLQRKYGKEKLKVNIADFQIATVDIEICSEEFPKPEEAKYPINLISIHLSKQDKTFTFGLGKYTGTICKNYWEFVDEKKMLETFIEFFRKAKISICTGWNAKLFDFPYIINRCKNLGIEKSLSPVDEYKENSTQAGYHIDGGGYTICGISILDGLDLYKNFEREKRVSYSLNSIGMLEVEEGKLDFEGALNDLWKTDWNKFVEYNLQDVDLVRKIEKKKKYIELAINLCYNSLVPFEKVFSSVNLITGLVLKYLHNHNMILPDRKVTKKDKKIPGAYVMANEGLHRYVINFDVESLYPTLIRTFKISPENLVLNPTNTDSLLSTPLSIKKTWETIDGAFEIGGIYYRNQNGVMDSIVSEVFAERKMFKDMKSIAEMIEKKIPTETIYKKYNKQLVDKVVEEEMNSEYYDGLQYCRKILSNSIYGSMLNEYFSLFCIENGMTVTLAGQNLIRFISSTTNDYFKKEWKNIAKRIFNKDVENIQSDILCLADTDSSYFSLDELIKSLQLTFKNNEEFRDFANKMIDEVFKPFFDKILKIYANRYGVEQLINFQRENIMTKMLILAKKKYAMEVIDKEGEYYKSPKLKIKGIEIVRTDSPKFCRNKIKFVIDEIFRTEDKKHILDVLRTLKKEFCISDPDSVASPSGISDYTKYAEPIDKYIENGLKYPLSCPIHVRASINYNYMLVKYKLPCTPVSNGSKMKYVYILDNNELGQNIIGFVGKWPEQFNEKFKVDYELQWEKCFLSVIERFFTVLGWGNKINLNQNKLEMLMGD